MTIDFGDIKQGSQPTLTFTWPLPASHTPTDFSGAVVTGTMKNSTTGDVTAVTGTLTVTVGATRTLAWALSAEDTGTAGAFRVTLKAVVGGLALYTLYGVLRVENNPAVTAVAGPAVVGVPVADATWLATATTAAAAGAQYQVGELDGDLNLAFTAAPRGYFMQATTIAAGETVTVPSGHQMLVFGDFIVDGDLVAVGDLVSL